MPHDNEKRIALWKNDKQGDKQPALRGTLHIDGVEYVVSLWRQEQKHDRSPFLAGQVQAKHETEQRDNNATAKPISDVLDDEVPF